MQKCNFDLTKLGGEIFYKGIVFKVVEIVYEYGERPKIIGDWEMIWPITSNQKNPEGITEEDQSRDRQA